MNTFTFRLMISICMISLLASGCRRNTDEVWEDSKTASRHMARGMKTLCGFYEDSRAVYSRDEFLPLTDQEYSAYEMEIGKEFVPLQDQAREDLVAMAEYVSRQPRETPGDPGSSLPGIDSFRDPSTDPALAGIFRNIYFDYNNSLIKGQDSLDIVHDIARYLKNNPNTYVFVEGHCDERGPEAYNLALGSRRSNAVRNVLMQQGVHPDHLFTISYGKERPLVHEHNEEAWAQNRRAEFKVYQR